MNVAFLAAGTVLLVLVVVDVLWTTVWVAGGAGPLTSRAMSATWRLLRSAGSRHSKLLTLSGPVVLVTTLTAWILLLWVGWTLVFASAERAVVSTASGRPVTWVDRVYFTGYTVFTLGIGDFVPRGGPWQVATVVASATGLLFVTLAVTYVLSVLGAVTQKRAFASSVSGLGASGVEILERSWDGDCFRGVEVPLVSLADQLTTLTSNHKAYPVLHYFYSEHPSRAPTTSIVVLDDALTLLAFGVAEAARPNELILAQARSSIQQYLDTLESAYVQPAARTPPPPDLATLRATEVPTVTDAAFEDSVSALEERRRLLLGLVSSDEREWPTGRRAE
jgi:hypothetical protein